MIFVSVPNIKTEIYAKSQHKSIFKQKQPPTENIFNVKDKYKTSDLLKIKKKTLKEIIMMKKYIYQDIVLSFLSIFPLLIRESTTLFKLSRWFILLLGFHAGAFYHMHSSRWLSSLLTAKMSL